MNILNFAVKTLGLLYYFTVVLLWAIKDRQPSNVDIFIFIFLCYSMISIQIEESNKSKV